MHIADTPLNGTFDGFLLIKNAAVKTDRNGDPFLVFTFQDASGTIDGLYWRATKAESAALRAGTIVYLRGSRTLYQGRPQLRIQAIRKARAGEPSHVEDFLPAGPLSTEEMHRELSTYVAAIEQPVIHAIVVAILERFHAAFYTYPATKRFHHAYRGGLAFHTLSVLRLAKDVAAHYDGIDKSLLYGGAILHDMAKVIEFSDPLAANYTVAGNLVGHVSLMAEEIALVADKLGYAQDEEAVALLKHMVLSHHGKPAYGSPVPPKLLEAEVLHRLDDLDAAINALFKAEAETPPGSFTAKLPSLDDRSFYIPSKNYKQA